MSRTATEVSSRRRLCRVSSVAPESLSSERLIFRFSSQHSRTFVSSGLDCCSQVKLVLGKTHSAPLSCIISKASTSSLSTSLR